MDPTHLTLHLLEEITNGFSEERKVGEGAYGTVYRGKYKNGYEIAVKKLYNHEPGFDDEKFKNEFVNLTRLEHPNIVRLVGYCFETKHKHIEYEGRLVFAEEIHRALCFEYLPGGSLDNHISDESDGLDWHKRYKIIRGICEGLQHIHGLKEPIYHLDLKPGNVLLDNNMVAKLADFGLSKIFSEERTRKTQTPIGTIGYLPPEYRDSNLVSNKLDIFSLGVVMIKIIAGRGGYSKSAQMPPQEFINLVQGNWKTRLQTTQNASVVDAYCQQVKACTEVALKCVEFDRHRRPNIVDIISKLNEIETATGKITNIPEITLLSIHSEKPPPNNEFTTPEANLPNKSSMNDFQEEQNENHYGSSSTKQDEGNGDEPQIIPLEYPHTLTDVHPSEPWIMLRPAYGPVSIINHHTQETVNFLETTDGGLVSSAKFIAQKQWFVVGGHDGFIRVYTYDPVRKVKRFKAHYMEVRYLDVHPTKPYLLSAGWSDQIKLWDWSKGWGCIKTFDMKEQAYQIKFNPMANNFAAACMYGAQVWNIGSSRREFTLSVSGDGLMVECLDYFTRGGQLYMITGSWDSTAMVWDCKSKTCVHTLKGHSDRVSCVCSHPDLPILLTGSHDETVRLWNSTTFKPEGVLDFELGKVTSIACLKGSRRIVVGHDGGLAITEICQEQAGGSNKS